MGERNSIYGFAALGLDIFEIKPYSGDGRKTLRHLAEGDYAIIYITEELYKELEDAAEEYNSLMTPAIIPIPSVNGSTGLGLSRVSGFVEKAVGSNII